MDTETLLITDALPANVQLFVGDLDGAGSGPVEFIDGASASGLGLDYGGLADQTDDIEFSVNGVDYSYVPTADADGFDATVRFVRIRPSGPFAGAPGPTPRSFELRFRVRLR